MLSQFYKAISRQRKLILASLDWSRPKDPPQSLGHASILTHLRQHSIPVIPQSWSVNHPDYRYEQTRDFIMQHAAEGTDVALGAFVWNETVTQRILTDLKTMKFPGRIIIGGPQVSYVKKNIEAYYPQADIFIRGYAEQPLAELMTATSTTPNIRGVHYANTPDAGLTAIADLNDLSSPYLNGVIKPQPFLRWETQRGCPFRCAFCQHRESDETTKRRTFALSRILQEAEWITANPIINDLAVLDPIFNSGPHYLAILDKLIEGRYAGKLSLQCRAEMVKEDFLTRIEKLNQSARVVLELGLQTAVPAEQTIIERPNNLKRVNDVFTELKKRNIESEVSLIFGLPEQTVASFQSSIDYCKFLEPTKILAFPLMLLRGTPLYDKKHQFGLIESNEVASDAIPRVQSNIPHVVASKSFTYTDWREMVKITEALEEYNQQKAIHRSRLFSSSTPNQPQSKKFGATETAKRPFVLT